MIESKEQNKEKHKEDMNDRPSDKDHQIGTQRVFKKSSPNTALTLYLPTRELVSTGSSQAIIKGILFVDPKYIEENRVYAQLTLTFRYGREDEEVMGLRFCNEAIISLHQIWPKTEEASRDSLTPLQDALIKRLGDGAYPFTLSLTPQAPPSVQLVPAKKYYGAPIGTSYDVRCFIAGKADEKFNRRATVRIGVRVIHRTDVSSICEPENCPTLVNNKSPLTNESLNNVNESASVFTRLKNSTLDKSKKADSKMDTFTKIRLSPKRFSARFRRSKSEVEKIPGNLFHNYNKSFQECETCGGPEGAVDKPFLLQEGRVSLRATLDKPWYAHGEDVIVTVNIKNDSRKTVRRIRVCAIQHVDVCMFNNGKFKNVVADTDVNSLDDQTVGPGCSFNSTFILKPQRGATKNWIALEDSLQRTSEPDEITGAIAASAVKSPYAFCNFDSTGLTDDRNVFAIYVSYYAKVKLTLSGMGGELSLKLPFALVHIDQLFKSIAEHSVDQNLNESINKLTICEPRSIRNIKKKAELMANTSDVDPESKGPDSILDKIESLSDEINAIGELDPLPQSKPKLVRHTAVKECCSDDDEKDTKRNNPIPVPSTATNDNSTIQQHITVQVHSTSS